MRTLNTLLLVGSALVVTSCGDNAVITPDMPTADLSMPDLTPIVDLARPDSAGLQCGNMTCATGQDCCIEGSPGSFTSTCMPTGTCQQDGGVILTCDGPEDCASAMPECCITASGMGMVSDGGASGNGAGQSSCVTKCVAVINADSTGMFTAHTRLCHVPDECAGLSGTLNTPLGTQHDVPFSKCCTTPQTGTLQTCLPQIATMFGATCQ